jgi:hypothetical protein
MNIPKVLERKTSKMWKSGDSIDHIPEVIVWMPFRIELCIPWPENKCYSHNIVTKKRKHFMTNLERPKTVERPVLSLLEMISQMLVIQKQLQKLRFPTTMSLKPTNERKQFKLVIAPERHFVYYSSEQVTYLANGKDWLSGKPF